MPVSFWNRDEQQVALVARADGVVADERDRLAAVLLLERRGPRHLGRLDGCRDGTLRGTLAGAARCGDAERDDQGQRPGQSRQHEHSSVPHCVPSLVSSGCTMTEVPTALTVRGALSPWRPYCQRGERAEEPAPDSHRPLRSCSRSWTPSASAVWPRRSRPSCRSCRG